MSNRHGRDYASEFSWSDAAVEAVKQHWADGLTATQAARVMARDFGCYVSRCARSAKFTALDVGR